MVNKNIVSYRFRKYCYEADVVRKVTIIMKPSERKNVISHTAYYTLSLKLKNESHEIIRQNRYKDKEIHI